MFPNKSVKFVFRAFYQSVSQLVNQRNKTAPIHAILPLTPHQWLYHSYLHHYRCLYSYS